MLGLLTGVGLSGLMTYHNNFETRKNIFWCSEYAMRTAARTLGLDESKMDTSQLLNWQIASSMIFLIFNLWPDILSIS